MTFKIKPADVDGILELAAHGLAVFPCNPATKAPRTRRGFKDASTDERTIRNWWTCWPDSLVAVATGEPSTVKLLVFDDDTARKPDPASTAWLEAAREVLQEARWHYTPTGGVHYLYEHDDNDEQPRSVAGHTTPDGTKLASIDVRAAGGYVIWWPLHGGGHKEAQIVIEGPDEIH